MSYYRQIPVRRLGRHVHHDPRSFNYSVTDVPEIDSVEIKSVEWPVNCGVLDQGDLGACVGYATTGNVATGPNYTALPTTKAGDLAPGARANSTARMVYSDATKMDNVPGQWPPNDTGSSGLGGAKAARKGGYISAYLHAFSLDAALKALMVGPIMVGTDWYSGMFDPTVSGQVVPTGDLAGGHEYMAYGYDAERSRVLFQNSWGSSWGQGGRFWMSTANLGTLLAKDGDVTSLVPLITVPAPPAPTPAPTPTPTPAPTPSPDDAKLWADMQAWAKRKGLA